MTSEATTAKPRPASPARAASMVALSASRLVWPAIAWIRPITSPMRVAAPPSSVMVLAVRCASDDGAAGDFGRFGGLARDLADRGGELLDRACRRGDVLRGGADAAFGGARFGRHRVGRAVELGRGRFELLRGAAQLAERLLDRALGTRRWSSAIAVAALLARARGLASGPRSAGRARSCCRGTRSRCAPSRRSRRTRGWPGIFAEVSPSASRFITSASPLSGRVMLRPISQLKPEADQRPPRSRRR